MHPIIRDNLKRHQKTQAEKATYARGWARIPANALKCRARASAQVLVRIDPARLYVYDGSLLALLLGH